MLAVVAERRTDMNTLTTTLRFAVVAVPVKPMLQRLVLMASAVAAVVREREELRCAVRAVAVLSLFAG